MPALRIMTPEPVSYRRPSFQALVNAYGQELPLDQALSVLAAEEQPGVDPADCLRAIDDMAESIHIPTGATVYEAVARINHHMFVTEGYRGDTDTYDHPDNSLINRVIERRQGLPILLSTLYIEIARRVGLNLVGVNFPAHFLVGAHHVDPRFFIDPFHEGEVLRDADLRRRLEVLAGSSEVEPKTWARFTAAASNDSILARVNNNLKRSWIRRGDLHGALRAIDRNLVLDPSSVVERRDRGVVLTKLDRPGDARVDLEHYLGAEPDAWDAAYIRKLLQSGGF